MCLYSDWWKHKKDLHDYVNDEMETAKPLSTIVRMQDQLRMKRFPRVIN